MTTSSFEQLSALGSLEGLKYDHFRTILCGRECRALVVEDIANADEADGEYHDDIARLPEVAPVGPQPSKRLRMKGPVRMVPIAHYQTMLFEFAAHGGEIIKIHLDGCKHTSGKRRCWAACPYQSAGHENCFKYLIHKTMDALGYI